MEHVDILVGLQWGDEGKGKFVDYLTQLVGYKVIARFQGGSNAGHTIYIEGEKFVLHTIPSGILSSDTTSVICQGVVVNPDEILEEIAALEKLDIVVKDRLFIDERCHVITKKHLAEDIDNQKKFGSTGKGIGPAYRDKVYRCGLRMKDLDPVKYKLLFDYFITDTRKLLMKHIKKGDDILFEGAQGIMLDLDFGTYPDVTSSSCLPQYAPVGSGLPLEVFETSVVYGVVSPYTLRIGTGPMPSEIDNAAVQKHIRLLGDEFGATTGRPRRIGWIDLVQLQYVSELTGVSVILLSRMDIAAQLEEIRVVTSYIKDENDIYEYIDDPDSYRYETFHPKEEDNWMEDYIDLIESYLDISVGLVGTGVDRKDIINRKSDRGITK